MLQRKWRERLEWLLVVGLVFGAGAAAQAQQDQDQNQPEGRVVHISPGSPGNHDDATRGDAAQARDTDPQVPRYWIGILGSPPTPELRAQVDLPEDRGILVRDVVPDSPAAEAGVETYDILLRANDTELKDMRDLIDLVRSEGARQGQITFDIVRHGQHETVWVTPTERPEQISGMTSRDERGGFGGDAFGREGLGPQFGFGEGRPFAFRSFRPQDFFGGQMFGAAELPDGVSISVRKEGDQPAHITVQRGDETWEIVGDDPDSLNQLPDDLRPVVEQVLHPTGLPGMHLPRPRMSEDGSALNMDELHQQMHDLQRQMHDLQQQMQQQFQQDNR